jgi:hypothetical protein
LTQANRISGALLIGFGVLLVGEIVVKLLFLGEGLI